MTKLSSTLPARALAEALDSVRARLDARRSGARLEVDGGITPETIVQAHAAGADTFVAGTAVFGASDIGAAVRELHRSCLARA